LSGAGVLYTPPAPPIELVATAPEASPLSSVLMSVTGGEYSPLFEAPGCHRKGVAA
jgi:hypothetical protein